MGFHAGQEAARILARSINFTRQGQIAVRDGAGASIVSASAFEALLALRSTSAGPSPLRRP